MYIARYVYMHLRAAFLCMYVLFYAVRLNCMPIYVLASIWFASSIWLTLNFLLNIILSNHFISYNFTFVQLPCHLHVATITDLNVGHACMYFLQLLDSFLHCLNLCNIKVMHLHNTHTMITYIQLPVASSSLISKILDSFPCLSSAVQLLALQSCIKFLSRPP